MAKAWKQYTKEMATKFGYLATWEPGVVHRLGDVGVLRRNLFTRIGTLESEGIPFEARPDESTTQMSHASSGKVQITFKAKGKPAIPGSVLGESQAGVTIEFTSENATVFEVSGCKNSSIEDQIALGRAILDRYAKGRWNKDWVVITELVSADSGTILISAAKNAKIELTASAEVSGAGFNLADAAAELRIEFMSNMHTRIIAAPDQELTPLFKARGLKSRHPLGSRFLGAGLRGTDLLTPIAGKGDLYFGEYGFEEMVDGTEESSVGR